jgi:hypothetical protein
MTEGIQGLQETIESSLLHVAKEVRRLDNDVSTLTNAVNTMRVELAVLKTKMIMITTIASMITGGTISYVVAVLGK